MNSYAKTMILVALLCLLGSVSGKFAWAVAWQEHPLLPWEQEALNAFQRNDYNGTIQQAQIQNEDPNWNAPLFIYYAHAQKWYLERSQDSAVYYKQQFPGLYNRLSGANLAVLTRLVQMPQLSWSKKVNKKFADAAFEKAGTDEYLGALLFYIENGQEDVSKSALKGLQILLQSKRSIVDNGGALSKKDRQWMQDAKTLKLLVRKAGENANPATGFLSKMPAFARKKVMGGASACLGLIQDPALPMLKQAAAMGNTSAAATIQIIQDARGERLAKFPNSTWYSATGR
jgi:hypothetical protein